MTNEIKIAASLLSANMACFERSIHQIADVVDYLHCDVMDAHFVPNLTFGAPVVKAIKKIAPLPLDVHLMIENPGRWVNSYLEAGLDENDYLTFHIEAEPDPTDALNTIRKAGVKCGLVIKPNTSVFSISEYAHLIDQVLIMTVEPGFGGQKFMSDMIEKVEIARKFIPANAVVGVDGGIDSTTAKLAFESGATILVAGNAIFGHSDPAKAARNIRSSLG